MQHPSLFLFAILATVAAAQGPSLTTKTSVGVFARSSGGVDLDTIAPNTAITAARRIEAAVDMADAALAVGPASIADSFQVHAMGHAGASMSGRGEAGSTPSAANTRPVPGAVEFLLHWRGDARRFQLGMQGEARDGGVAGVGLDVGDDNTLEFRQAVDGSRHGFDFVLGGRGATVARLIVSGHAQPATGAMRAMYQVSVTLGGGREPCRFTNYGAGCQGLTLSGVDRGMGMHHQIELTVRGAFPSLPVVLMFGVRRLDLPIHGDCRLLVQPMAALMLRADERGNLVHTISRGSELCGHTMFMQAAAMRMGHMMEMKTSNGTRMECGH